MEFPSESIKLHLSIYLDNNLTDLLFFFNFILLDTLTKWITLK